MTGLPFYNSQVECMERSDLDALIEERIRYTVRYAEENSPFYRHWFHEHSINVKEIREHEDLQELPIISGQTIREHQPPFKTDFEFRSSPLEDIFTIHETSGTSGTPKSFFLTWEDWNRYAEKYARAFVSQGFKKGDRLLICASYGMNVGANTMTLAAHNIGFTVIPYGKCSFPVKVMERYKPTGIVGSVFKLLRLASRMKAEGEDPKLSSIERLVVGGESFAEESRQYLSEVWDRPVYNTYGSTEGTMCGECTEKSGLHIPEDLVHLDLYDPSLNNFVPEGECGRIVLTTLLPSNGRCGALLLNYDTEDTSTIISQAKCNCGRTHMKIYSPQREAETVWVAGTPFNRVDIERAVFERENMESLTGEYEAFLYGGEEEGSTILRVSLETSDPEPSEKKAIESRFTESLLKYKHRLKDAFSDNIFEILFNFSGPGSLELGKTKGRAKRLVDRRG